MRPAKLKAVDFFCGGGGMSLGMCNAGIEVIAGIDNDVQCKETYLANHKNAKFIQEDIKNYPVEVLGEETGIKKSDDNLVFIGCSPCQYWSIITGHKDSVRKETARDGRNLMGDFVRFVEYYHPNFVVIENVPGIEKESASSGLDNLYDLFDSNGYIYDKKVLSLNDFGVPQTRRRFILIASRVIEKINFPAAQKKKVTVRDIIGGRNQQAIIEAGESDGKDKMHRCAGLSKKNIERLALTPEGGLRESWANRDDLQIDAYRNKPKTLFPRNYGRMAWDKPAPTITTYFHSISSGRFAHPVQNRAISLREGAMLQTFPKSYKFKTTSIAATAKIIGNAVPPKFAKSIGEVIVKQWQG